MSKSKITSAVVSKMVPRKATIILSLGVLALLVCGTFAKNIGKGKKANWYSRSRLDLM